MRVTRLGRHGWVEDWLHEGRGRLRYLLAEVSLAIGVETERWGLTLGKLLELLMDRSLGNSSRLDYLGD